MSVSGDRQRRSERPPGSPPDRLADRHPALGGGLVVAPGRSRTPERTCIGCRARFPQESLLRLRWDGSQVVLEGPRARGPGRGAYLCAKMSCWESARKRHALGRALRLTGRLIDHEAVSVALTGMITGSPGHPDVTPVTRA